MALELAVAAVADGGSTDANDDDDDGDDDDGEGDDDDDDDDDGDGVFDDGADADDDGVFDEDVQVSARARALKAGDDAGATVPAETRQVRCADAVAAEGGTQPLL
jgi:hypothetical protein